MRLLVNGNFLYFDGRAYLKTKLALFGYCNANGDFKKELAVKTPMRGGEKLDPKSPASSNPRFAMMLTGALVWASVMFRPDIKPAVLRITRCMRAPTKQAEAWCDWLWRYLGGTIDVMLFVKRDERYQKSMFSSQFIHWGNGAFDATWEVPKSVSGFVIYVFGLLVACKSCMQATTALSSTEAEILALLLCCKTGVFVRQFVAELCGVGLTNLPPLLLLGDNIGALKAGREGAIPSLLKHMNLAEIKISEWKSVGHFEFRQTPSFDNTADYMAKPGTVDMTVRHRDKFMRKYGSA